MNGDWIIQRTDNPTEDQAEFSKNFEALKDIFGDNLSLSTDKMAHLASALTDRGFDLSANPIANFGNYYLQYKGLLASGEVQSGGAVDFVDWLYNQLGVCVVYKPNKIRHSNQS